jgi:hypothetical protein
MVRLTARQLRAGVVPALPLLVAALWAAPAAAQIRPPHPGGGFQGRMPGMGGPLFETVWKCGRCGREVARGNTPPPASCPFCGVRFINGFGPPGPAPNNGNQPAPNNGQANNPMPGMMPPANQNSGQVPPNNPLPNPAAPQGDAQANAAPPAAPPPVVLPPVVNDPPAAEDPPAAANSAGKGVQVGSGPSPTHSGSRIPAAARVLIGLAAVLAALVLLVVGGIVVYNLAVANTAEPAGRPRRRRRLAEVD